MAIGVLFKRVAAAMRTKPRAIRWLVAELIPFTCLFLAMPLANIGVSPVSFVLGVVVGIPLTMWYLNWVLDTHAGWSLPLILLMLAATYVGIAIFGHTTSNGEPLVVTPTYVEVFGGLLIALAVTVALAIANGERHRGRYRYVVER